MRDASKHRSYSDDEGWNKVKNFLENQECCSLWKVAITMILSLLSKFGRILQNLRKKCYSVRRRLVLCQCGIEQFVLGCFC